jgi:hypothetical protein
MVDINYVEDEEELYRSVRADPQYDEYTYNDDGELIISYKAFQDRNREPSVDRAELRAFRPEDSKRGEKDGIVSLITQEVRGIGQVVTRVSEKENISHAVDVIPRPIEDNESHAQVEVEPNFFGSDNKQNKAFKLLRKSLARLATNRGWTLKPEK